MKSTLMRITFIFLAALFLFMSNHSYSIAERRIALVIGNGSYDFGRLKNSVNDANDIAATLRKFGFSVIIKNDVGHKEMETAIKELGCQLKKEDVGLFFYAGHGVQIEGQNYLIPIGANIEEESDVKYRAVNLSRILEVMDGAGSKLNIIILDACRNNPYAKSFRSTSRGLAIVEKSPKDTLIAYSTSPNQVAIDGSGRNSPYTKALLDNMIVPGMPIEQVFKKIRNSLDNVTGGKQVPWYISSLGVDFYFNAEKFTALESSKLEQIKQYEETSLLAKEKQLLNEKGKSLEKESSKNTDKKKTLSTEDHTASLAVRATGKDGRFIAYNNGTVLDTGTGMMWAASDNGSGITWQGAKKYCETYRGGGYTDWRMPTQNELATLYDSQINGMNGFNLTRFIELTKCCPWALENSASAAFFRFDGGEKGWTKWPLTFLSYRALPVRYDELQRTIEEFNKAIRLKSDDADAYYKMGIVYGKLGQHQRAIEDFNNAIRLKPNNASAYYNRGRAYGLLGEYQLAIDDLNEAIRLQPDDALAYNDRGVGYANLGQYQHAIKDYNEAIGLKPDYTLAYGNRGRAYLLHDNKNLGCRDAQKACDLGNCKTIEWAKYNRYCR